MTTWVTFSNGERFCQTGVYERELAKCKEMGWPIRTYGSHPTEYIDFEKMNPEQKTLLGKFEKAYLQEEANAFIEKTWPGQGITILSRQSLPYGARPHFGSGDTGGFFCMQPSLCAGRSSCPRRYACSE